MRYKALAVDLDGTTLVGEDLPPANKLALRRAADAGYEIIIATARWIQMAHRVADEVGIDSLAIACSGAQVHDRKLGRDIFDHRLPTDFVEELYTLCNAKRCIATVTVSNQVWIKMDGDPDPDLLGEEMTAVRQLEADANDLPRIAAIQGTAICEEIKAQLKPRFADRVNIFDSIGPTGRLVITITAKAASKGAALQAACDHLSLQPHEVVAFGDAENDLAMFAIAGASVAMGQAEPEVKAVADYISTANFEDGVANAIEHLLTHGDVK